MQYPRLIRARAFKTLLLVFYLVILFQSAFSEAGSKKPEEFPGCSFLKEVDFQKLLSDWQFRDSSEKCEAPLFIDDLRCVDFLKRGRPQIITIGSTCFTGTAGPDIHAVFELVDKKLKELPVEESKTFNGKPIFESLRGNRNFRFQVEGDGLISQWHSREGGSLRIKYRWDGKMFKIVEVVQ